jgi:hypothetical protein
MAHRTAAVVSGAGTHYEPYGVPTGATGTFTTDFRCAGEQAGNNGLSFNRARYDHRRKAGVSCAGEAIRRA